MQWIWKMVKVTSRVDEEGALSITMDGKNMGILIGKTRTDTGFSSVSYKQSCKQNAGWICQSKTRHRGLQKKKKRDS